MSTTHEFATAILAAPERPFWDELGIEGLAKLQKEGERIMTTQQEREKITLTRDQAIDATEGQSPEGFSVESDKRQGKSRWHEIRQIVLRRESDGKLFADTYRLGLTESQDNEMWEYNEPDFKEVFPVEKTVIVYE